MSSTQRWIAAAWCLLGASLIAGVLWTTHDADRERTPDAASNALEDASSRIPAKGGASTDAQRGAETARRAMRALRDENAAATAQAAAEREARAAQLRAEKARLQAELDAARAEATESDPEPSTEDGQSNDSGSQVQTSTHDSGLAVIRRYLETDADVSTIVSDFQSMRRHIQLGEGRVRRIEFSGKRTDVKLALIDAEHSVLEFGEGEFVLDAKGTNVNVLSHSVQSLEIRGAGMNRTRLIGPGWAFLCTTGRGRLENLVIRDLTIDSREKGQIPLDARGGVSAALERVRFDGWEVAGHSAAIGVSGDAFLAAKDCEFLGKGDGFVLSLRGQALALLEGCRFVDTRGVIIASDWDARGSLVRMNDCRFDGVPLTDRPLKSGEFGGTTVQVRGGRAELGGSSWTAEQREKRFCVKQDADIEGLTYEATRPLFSVGDAVRALDLAHAQGLRNIMALTVAGRGRGRPVDVDFYLVPKKPGVRPTRERRVFQAGELTKPDTTARRGARNFIEITMADFERALPLADLLRRADLPADENLVQAAFTPLGPIDGKPGSPRRLSLSVAFENQQGVGVDAVTLKELWRR